MAAPLDGLPVGQASLVALLGAAVLAVLALGRIEDRRGVTAPLRRRFVLGIPWGTVIVVVFVLAVYLVIQGAWGRLHDPVVVGFRAWSYTYPLGMIVAPFAHNGLGHITGNLLATVVFAPVAEYAWGHYPTERGSQTFSSLRTNPYARIGAFVAGVLAVGLATSYLVPGPLIGFSGVVFAFAGLAIVARPVAAVFAIVATRVVDLAYFSALDPVVTATAEPRFVTPWWADIAVQAHALGLLLGAIVGVWLVARRSETPSARYIWFAALVFAVTESLWALYWQFGADTFVLFRGAGLAVVLVLVTVVVIGAATDRPFRDRSSINGRQAAVGFLLAVVLAIGLAAVPYNLVNIDNDLDGGVEVRDYTVGYAEGVQNEYVDGVRLPILGDRLAGTVTASGVIVTSERRDAWMEVVPAGSLGFDGRRSVTVGGLGWRETVIANRSTWNAVDAGSTYKVHLRRAGNPPQLVFQAEPVRLAPRIAGVNLSIEPTADGYRLNATRNGTIVGRAPVPAGNESATVAEITFERRDDDLFAVHEDTRIRVAVFRAGEQQTRLRSA